MSVSRWEGLVPAFWWEEESFFFPLWWAVLYKALCFEVAVGSLSADIWVCVFVLPVVWLRHPALGVASSWVMPGLGYRWRP